MAQTVKLKRSAVPGKVPTTSDLDLGELALNTHDGKLFLKRDNGAESIVELGVGGSNDPLDLIYRENPALPAADTVRLFGRRIAGRMMPAYIDPSGLDSTLQPWLAQNKIAWFNPPGNVPTVNQFGMAVATTGTGTGAAVGTANIHQAMRRLEYAVTTASTSAVAGIRGGANQFHIGDAATPFGGFTFIARFGPSRGSAANATRRFFAGMTSRTSVPTDVDPSAGTAWGNIIGVGDIVFARKALFELEVPRSTRLGPSDTTRFNFEGSAQ